jgi:hypothetical protein
MGKKQNLTVQAERGHWDGKRSIISKSSRRATRTILIPEAAICCANSLPIPDEAPVTSAQGRTFFYRARLSSFRSVLPA